MESNGLREALVARSRISSLEELESRGRQRVKIIRADHIAELIDAAVEQALEDARGDGIPRAEVEALLEAARREALEAIARRQAEVERLTAELDAAQQRIAELGAPTVTTAPAAGAANAAADAIADAVSQLNAAMTERLEKMSRKLGISTAVEADQVDFSNLFAHETHEAPVESNLDNMQVKSKSGTGIAANLERLKKLKGGD